MARQWPEPKDGEPRQHIKTEQQDERSAFNAWNNDIDFPLAGLTVKQAAWLAWLKRSGTIKSFDNPEQYDHQGYSVLNGWIKCSERMPEKDGKYLVASSFGIVTAWFDPAWSNKFQDCDTNCDEGMEDFEGKIFRVTHWQSLPAAPQQGDE